ncbi:glycosyltransferase family 4 protein [Marinomonas communis]|uniref:Glycosyltransferase involved in cell wall biosynthesis n=1 Tax=Marinomonas communis TaxID=28254 RepID=A0A4R6XBY9_9GAMM|nr:glycosyltransferase family 4 protein [Marinomonas communis]TDR13078.1 glycosyltransferase involved in cell wall biosynthesis [Marinomonas communis]
MSKRKLVIVQRVVPSYSYDFFNSISRSLPSNWRLVVISDFVSKNELNQFSEECLFEKINYKMKGLFSLDLDYSFFLKLRKCDADIIVFSGNTRSLFTIPSMFYFKLKGVSVFSWGMFHRIGESSLISNFLYRAYSLFSEKVLCYSRVGARNLISLGVDGNKISIIGTAINQDKPIFEHKAASKERIDEILKKYDLSGKKVVIQVVRLSEIKKPLLIVEVAKKLLKEDPDYRFVVIGEGELKIKLLESIKRNQLEKEIISLGSIYDEKELACWFSISSVYVIPTCIGLSAHHAMSYSLPVITDNSITYQASEFDIISNGLNGLVYEEGDISDFCNKISRVCNNLEYREFLSVNALVSVRDVHNLENKVSNFIRSLGI